MRSSEDRPMDPDTEIQCVSSLLSDPLCWLERMSQRIRAAGGGRLCVTYWAQHLAPLISCSIFSHRPP